MKSDRDSGDTDTHRRRHVAWPDRRRRLASLARAALLGLLRWPAYFFVGLVPKDPGSCAFGSWSGDRFADNAKWLFLYMTAPGRPWGGQIAWVSRRRSVVRHIRSLGRPAHWLWSPQGLATVIRSGVHVIDADSRGVAFWASRGVALVNLYHGIALKHIGADVALDGHHLSAPFRGPVWRRVAIRLLAPWLVERYRIIVASSPVNAQVMMSAFRASAADVVVTGLPRNDVLRLSDEEMVAHFGIAPRRTVAPGQRSVLYAPTFRDFDRTGRSIPLDWEGIDGLMEQHDSVFLLKLHPHDAACTPSLAEYSRIQLLPGDSDIYPILRHTEVLITDYSSVFFDFLLCDRPVIFYAYDIAHYRKRDRGFYYAYEDVTPGPRVHNPRQLLRRLDEVLTRGDPDHSQARRLVRERFHSTEASLACQAVSQRLRALSP
jgi:CDP-glycerol glycerophosphotransferase (TagB/SpsB family)